MLTVPNNSKTDHLKSAAFSAHVSMHRFRIVAGYHSQVCGGFGAVARPASRWIKHGRSLSSKLQRPAGGRSNRKRQA